MGYNETVEIRDQIKAAATAISDAMNVAHREDLDEELFEKLNAQYAELYSLYLQVDVRCLVRCVSDRYDRNGETYRSVSEFTEMCRGCFGEAPVLTQKADGWHDSTGLVLVVANP